MKIHLKAAGFEITPSLREFVEKKLMSLGRFVKKFDAEGAIELWVEVAKITEHHRKGNIYYAEANLRMPKKSIRAEEGSPDLHIAVDRLKHVLQLEIEKYKTKHGTRPRRSDKNA